MRRVRDPVHGSVPLRPLEAALLDTRPMQRLRRIRQLGLTHLVFPGAEHSRFGHSVGACHVAGRLADALVAAGWDGDVGLVRAAALLHDVGHPPFSHAGEQGEPHERMSARVIRETEIADVLRRFGRSAEDVLGAFDPARAPVEAAIVSGQVDADRMDYLLRDGYMCGVPYGRFDLGGLVDALALGADGRPAVHRAGLQAVEGLLLARYGMFLQVYFHRTRRVLDRLLEQVMPEWPDDVDAWLEWDDGRVFELLRDDPRPAARALRHREGIPACVAEIELSAAPARRDAADALARHLAEHLGVPPLVDSSARLEAFRVGGDIRILDEDGSVYSVFEASPVLRRMDPGVEIRRIYVPREVAAEGRAIAARFRREGVQLRLFEA